MLNKQIDDQNVLIDFSGIYFPVFNENLSCVQKLYHNIDYLFYLLL